MSAAPLPDGRLEQQLEDGKPLYTPGEAVAEANRCLFCHDAPCITACPTGIDIPRFIRKIATDNLRGSAETILSANLLGYSCARVCPVEVLCAGACVYNAWERTPIAIGRLQRYATETVFTRGEAATLLPRAAANGKRIACVGAGPASLAAAGYLALEGCEVTVLDRSPLPGGLNTTGVAPYKMPAEDSLREFAFLASLGVRFKGGVEVGSDVTVEALLAGHDAVFLAPGLGGDTPLALPGADGAGVHGATAWIEHMKLDPAASLAGVTRAVVVGGGNTAIDAARELAQLGVPEVSLLYRRTQADMSGYAHELEAARAEGVRFVEQAVPAAFVRENGALRALQLSDGREFSCELVVVAIGQASLAALAQSFPGVATDAKGRIEVDADTCATGNPRVWAGGDAIGGELVVTAVQDGKRAARAIATALGIPVREGAPMHAGHGTVRT